MRGSFGSQELRQYRQEHGLSLTQLGELLGVDPDLIREWEEGRRPREFYAHRVAILRLLSGRAGPGSEMI